MFISEPASLLATPKDGCAFYSAVIYLSPADYHHYHAPVEMEVMQRTHVSGRVLPINPKFVKRYQNLFSVQERLVLKSQWEGDHLFFYTAVAAYNVGDMTLTFDAAAKTNRPALPRTNSRVGRTVQKVSGKIHQDKYDFNPFKSAVHSHSYVDYDASLRLLDDKEASTPSTIASLNGHSDDPIPEGVRLARGEEVGEFKLGSTIVLIFEAPIGMRCRVPFGPVKLGEALFSLD